jgi:hypothetical protein
MHHVKNCATLQHNAAAAQIRKLPDRIWQARPGPLELGQPNPPLLRDPGSEWAGSGPAGPTQAPGGPVRAHQHPKPVAKLDLPGRKGQITTARQWRRFFGHCPPGALLCSLFPVQHRPQPDVGGDCDGRVVAQSPAGSRAGRLVGRARMASGLSRLCSASAARGPVATVRGSVGPGSTSPRLLCYCPAAILRPAAVPLAHSRSPIALQTETDPAAAHAAAPAQCNAARH